MHSTVATVHIESSSRSKEGRDGQQMSPEFLNKAFSMKSIQCIGKNCHEKPIILMGPCFQRYNRRM